MPEIASHNSNTNRDSTRTGVTTMDKQTERGFVLFYQEYNMKNRWGLFSAAIFFGFLSSRRRRFRTRQYFLWFLD
jgi:hypothetical protein